MSLKIDDKTFTKESIMFANEYIKKHYRGENNAHLAMTMNFLAHGFYMGKAEALRDHNTKMKWFIKDVQKKSKLASQFYVKKKGPFPDCHHLAIASVQLAFLEGYESFRA
jgi:hypothetical protein